MKKITIVVLVMLLVASIGQVASAKGSVGAFAGYNITGKGFSVAVNGEYEFVNWFSLAGEAEVVIAKDEPSGKIGVAYLFDLEGKFTFLNIGKVNLGAKIFATSVVESGYTPVLVVGPGICVNATFLEKLKVELEYGFSLLAVNFATGKVEFFPLPYFADLGISYALSDNISLGIKGKLRVGILDLGLAFEYSF